MRAAADIATALAGLRALNAERRRAEALAELDRAKTSFFSNVSHEFRTPLTLMLGPLEDCSPTAARSVAASDREQLDVVHRNGLRLLKLVNTLLDFSRIEAGRVQAELRTDRSCRAYRGPGQRLPLRRRTRRAEAGRRLRRRCPSRSTSTATCGRRSSSTCCRTPQVHLRGRDRGDVEALGGDGRC